MTAKCVYILMLHTCLTFKFQMASLLVVPKVSSVKPCMNFYSKFILILYFNLDPVSDKKGLQMHLHLCCTYTFTQFTMMFKAISLKQLFPLFLSDKQLERIKFDRLSLLQLAQKFLCIFLEFINIQLLEPITSLKKLLIHL